MAHDFVKDVDRLKQHRVGFQLNPNQWRSSLVTQHITWSYVDFKKENRNIIPKKRGVYAFIVQHRNSHFPAHGFIMYIGITGAASKGRTLYVRYGDYLREQLAGRRPKLYYMLSKYPDDLQFAYSSIPDDVDLSELECQLNDAILPPANSQDFSADIRKKIKAIL